MSDRLSPASVVVVGLGAAGGIAALALARAGIDVVGLEAGPRRSSRDARFDEIANDIRNRLGAPKVNQEIPTIRSDTKSTAVPGSFGIMSNGVGGSSVSYGGQCHRYTPWHFHPASATKARYGSSLGDGAWLEDWPISYESVAPYYDLVEDLLGVSGRAGNVEGRLTGTGNPFEGARSSEFPLAPLRESGANRLAHDAAVRLGWHPYAGPVAVHSSPLLGGRGCTYCGFCVFNHCHLDAKAATSVRAIPEAEESGYLQVVENARAVEITVDRDGLASGVNYLRGGRMVHQPARIVLLAGFTYENVRLLLLSKSSAYPRGLSNNHGMVGRGYISIGQIWGYGVAEGRRLNAFGGLSGQHVAVDDWDADNFDHSALSFVGGGHLISATMEAKPIATARMTPPSVPRGWGIQWKRWIRSNSHSVIRMLAAVEGFANDANTLDLDPSHVDALGLARLRITYSPSAQDEQRAAFVRERMHRWLQEMGVSEYWSTVTHGQITARAIGGARMGKDMDTSVVNEFGLSHEVPNLAVLGGATFLNSPGPGPTGTIQALAWRTAEYVSRHFEGIAR